MSRGDIAEELRQAFDASFSRAIEIDDTPTVELLVVRAGGANLAIRAAEVRALTTCPELVEIPATSPALLGVGTIRGAVVGLYSLGELEGGVRGRGRWVALCGDGTVGLVFDELGRHDRVPARDIRRSAERDRSFVGITGVPHVLVGVAALLEKLSAKSGETA